VGARAGLAVDKLLEVVQASTGDSYSLNLFPHVIFKRNFEPAKFALSLAAKDLRIARQFAADLGVPVGVVERTSELLNLAIQHGMADKDWSTYITLLEAAAGVEVKP
jgi:3-hydroxyisobutyrate dehydrogenase-like beta-hydroxyacid dehydrogenase